MPLVDLVFRILGPKERPPEWAWWGAFGGAGHVEVLRALFSSSGHLGLIVDLLSYDLAPHGYPLRAPPLGEQED